MTGEDILGLKMDVAGFYKSKSLGKTRTRVKKAKRLFRT